MLLRFYRLTDKFGIVIIKLGAAIADWLLESASVITSVAGRVTGGSFGIISGIVLALASFVWALLKQIGKLLSVIVSFIARLSGRTGKMGGAALTSGANAASNAMARRAARDEIDVIVREDPLKVQNRRLSFLVLVLGVAVLAAVIWTTDPNRTQAALPVAVAPITNNDNVNVADAAELPTEIGVVPAIATPIPTATALPEALQARGAIAYTVREAGQTDIWALDVGSRNPIRITNDVADERDPEWNADGSRLAYAARIDGNWDLFVYDAFQNATSRLTVEASFQANPTWDPVGNFIAYENYQNDNLDIFAVPIDNSQAPQAITIHPAPDYSPAWGPDTRTIAFVSLRDGNADIYIINLDDPEPINITNTPNINEDHPTWSPDGRSIAYSAREPGAIAETVFVQSMDDLNAPPQLVAVGRSPAWSPDGTSITYAVDSIQNNRTDLYAVTFGEASVPILISSVVPGATSPTWTLQPLPAALVNSGGLPLGDSEPLFIEQTNTFDGEDFQLQSLGNVQTDQPFLSDAVNDSFDALRQTVLEDTGLDFLGRLDDAFWRIDRLPDAGEAPRSWHRTGRAFAISRTGYLGVPPPVEIVREDIGNQTYWRVYVRVSDESQRGQLGEPLRQLPWDFLATDLGDVDAYNQGGRLRREVPTGYYIDFTILSSDYGWERIPAGSDWIANERARNFWLFLNDDNLPWCAAMLQLYSEGELVNYNCTG